MNWRQIMKRELKQIFVTDPRRAFFVLGSTLVYLVLFSMLYGTHIVKNVPLVIYDEDQSRLSRELIQAFDDSERFRIVGYVSDEAEMEQYLREKEAFGAVHIPAKFSQRIKTGMATPVLVIANGANLVIANPIMTESQDLVTAFSRANGASLLETAGLPSDASQRLAGPISYRLRTLNNPALNYQDYFVLGLAMAAFLEGIFLAIGASIIGERQAPGELAGSSVGQVLVGKLLPYWLCSLVAFSTMVAISVEVFDIPCKGSYFDLLLLAAAFSLVIIGMGVVVALFCDSEVTFNKIGLIYAVPSFILSGHIWPQLAMDAITRTLAFAFPLFYFADAVRDTMVAGQSPLLYSNVAVLSLMGTVLLTVSALVYRRRQGPIAARRGLEL
jgi:ABC-2 type transport system permease protein